MIRVALAALAAAAGAAIGVGIGLAAGKTYEARAVLQVLPVPEARRLTAEVQARTYSELVEERSFLEQIRAQVAAGRYETDELVERVDGRHEEGSALFEIAAAGESPTEARTLATDVSGALLGFVRQTARQRSAQVEDELRRRIEELEDKIRDAAGNAARLEALREERAQLNERLATTAGSAVEEGTRLVLAAAPVPEERSATGLWAYALIGAGIGLVAGTAAPALVRRRRIPRPPVVVHPAAGSVVTGGVSVRADPDAAVEWSRDAVAWTAVDGAWDTAALADGPYLLRARGSQEAIPVEVDNTPPAVTVLQPERSGRRILLRADASDAGSGVASVTFMVSDGSPEWTEVPSEWEPPAPGVYWVCAVAADRAGHRAASELVPVRIPSL